MKILTNRKVAVAAIALAITGCGSDTLPDEEGNSFGRLALSGTPLVGETLTATVTDANGVDGAISYTWMADDVTIAGATSSTYTLTDAEVGANISVSVAYTDNDDYQERIKSSETSAVVGVDVPATFSGLTSNVANNVTEALTGTVVVSDDDPGESLAEDQTDVATTFGVFSIDETGAWTYVLDTSNSTVSSLVDENDTVTDTISIASIDGTPAELVITIFGAPNSVGGEPTQAAKITDSMTDDAGELRLKLDSAISQGKLTVSFLKEDKAETADGVAKDAYIGLFGESTSTSNAIVDLRIQADKFVIRDQDDIAVSVPFVPGVWTDVEMTWDASAATDSVAPLVTISINGTSVTTEAFSSASSSLSDVMTGVRHVIFKLGDNSSTIPDAAYYVDDIKLYSDLAGTTIAFEDDFEGYSEGDSLDTDNDASPYNSSTAEAVVELVGSGGDGDVANPDNQVAQITDNMTDDAGELRYKTDAAVAQGKLSVWFFKEDLAETAEGVAKDAYIGLYGESTSTSNAIVDLRIQANQFVIRGRDDLDVAIPFVPDTWTEVVMTWDATAASASVAPLVTIEINGTSVTTEAFSSASASLSDVMTGVRYAIFKLGDNSSTIPNAAYFVDDVKLYSDMAGTAVVFEDDFEGYAVGDSLDTDNGASPYNSSTAEAVVAVKGK